MTPSQRKLLSQAIGNLTNHINFVTRSDYDPSIMIRELKLTRSLLDVALHEAAYAQNPAPTTVYIIRDRLHADQLAEAYQISGFLYIGATETLNYKDLPHPYHKQIFCHRDNNVAMSYLASLGFTLQYGAQP